MTGRRPGEGDLLVLLDQLIRDVADVATDPDDGFFEAGLTSAQLIQVCDHLRQRLGSDLPVTALFRYPTRRALARWLAESGVDSDPEPAAAPAPRPPVGWTGHRTAQDRRALRSRLRAQTAPKQG